MGIQCLICQQFLEECSHSSPATSDKCPAQTWVSQSSAETSHSSTVHHWKQPERWWSLQTSEDFALIHWLPCCLRVLHWMMMLISKFRFYLIYSWILLDSLSTWLRDVSIFALNCFRWLLLTRPNVQSTKSPTTLSGLMSLFSLWSICKILSELIIIYLVWWTSNLSKTFSTNFICLFPELMTASRNSLVSLDMSVEGVFSSFWNWSKEDLAWKCTRSRKHHKETTFHTWRRPWWNSWTSRVDERWTKSGEI